MTDLERKLRARVEAGEKMLAPYVTAGYPDLATTAEILRAIDDLGLGCVEIGIPFSDPVADGPTIQASFTAALEAGLKVKDLFATLGTLAGELVTPRIAMVSYSVACRHGPDRFIAAAAQAGLAGVLFPDLPMGCEPEVGRLAESAGLADVMLVAPTTPPQRRAEIAAASTGFVYYISVAGITGERRELPAEVGPNVAALKQAGGGKPVFVGFGIGRPEQVAEVTAVADGAIVGSALVRQMTECAKAAKSPQATGLEIRRFVQGLCGGLGKAVTARK
ncbi:MAG: Tryptophan synthase alpha chain [Phycisphaerae bacterium]|nr:Tryptophan synthase alpha chain [Phycisphaerae bacterium]